MSRFAALGGDAAGWVAEFFRGAYEIENPVAKVFRLFSPCEVDGDEVAVPVPELLVESGGDAVGVGDEA